MQERLFVISIELLLEQVQRNARRRSFRHRGSAFTRARFHRLLDQLPAIDARLAQVNFQLGRARQRALDQRFD